MKELLGRFCFSKYSFVLKAKDILMLPPYKGSTLRGGFGVTFRRICCVNKKEESCKACAFKEKCAYSYIFETSPSQDTEKLKNLDEIPRPFIIEPPLENKTIYQPGETLGFNLILIGKAIDYFPYFILAFKELGNVGIGKNRGKYELDSIYDSHQKEIYNSHDEIIKDADFKITINDFLDSYLFKDGILSLFFTTPTRIKYKSDLIVKPEFHIILRALLHRVSALSYFHCGEELGVDYKSLISQAERVKIEKSGVSWVDWERYSSRQDTRMKLGGFMGEITYTGDFESFLSLVSLGQFIHIGKNCTFGLGRYEIK